MADIYRTENSIYVIDKDNQRYKRVPVNKSAPHSPRIKYDVWLPLQAGPNSVRVVDGHLHIMHETSVYGIMTSPVTFSLYGVSPNYLETDDCEVYV